MVSAELFGNVFTFYIAQKNLIQIRENLDNYDIESPEYLLLISSDVSHSQSGAESYRRGQNGGLFHGAQLLL